LRFVLALLVGVVSALILDNYLSEWGAFICGFLIIFSLLALMGGNRDRN
jgi:hypothetical protein